MSDDRSRRRVIQRASQTERLTMRRLVFTAMLLVLSVLAVPARAIDCRKASSAIEHLICADPRLQSADAAMGRAYESALKATDDVEIRTMLATSQKRWLVSRDKRLGQFGPDQDAPDRVSQRKILLDAMQDRTNGLTQRSRADPKLLRVVATALDQRHFAAQFTGGPFAGIETSCDFFPTSGRYVYGCFAMHHYQNNNRVCSAEQDWATYRIYENHEVADVVDGTLKTTATCSDGAGDSATQCPDPDDKSDPGHWNRHPDSAAAEAPPPHSLPQLDSEIGADMDRSWLSACLTTTDYPPMEGIAK